MSDMFWSKKRVLITGHTGFKGGWLSLWLQSKGANVCGLALPPPSKPNIFTIGEVAQGMESHLGDIRDAAFVQKVVSGFKPEIILHLAAQPLVRYSYTHPVETYHTNVLGLVNVFEAVRSIDSCRAFVNVTTDKCYENNEWVWGYRENEPMGGFDPYSSSKGCAELVTSAYRRSYFEPIGMGLASARAGNVIGGGDWAEDRLIPDILSAFDREEAVLIRNPNSIRPWQHVLEPLSGYLTLAEHLWESPKCFSEGWNFGPSDSDAKPVSWIVDKLKELWPTKAAWLVDEESQPHEATYLKLDISKAANLLKWRPSWSLEEALHRVVEWHSAWRLGADMREKTLEQISVYEQIRFS